MMENMHVLASLGIFLAGVGIILLGCGLMWYLSMNLPKNNNHKK